MHENQSKPWCPADLFFLSDALRRGMKPEAVAGFLGRTESEVIAKAKAFRISVTEQRAGVESTQERASFASAHRPRK
jgi:hypothetical protein